MDKEIIGSWIDNLYYVKEKIGEGGMGKVYLVEDRKSKELYALKAIYSGSKDAAESFKQEVEVLKNYSHENIVKFITAGFDEVHHIFYIVMEYIYGKDIKSYIRSSNVGLTEKIQLFIQLCEVLKFIHSKGIIHRDIKPSNIIVIEGNIRRIKLLDFGVSKLFDTLTHGQTLASKFTKAYMAPEQLERTGTSEQTDIYQLGITFIELLSKDESFNEFLRNDNKEIIFDDISNLYYYQDESRKLSEILRKCIEPKKENRFINIQDLKIAFTKYLKELPQKQRIEIFISKSVIERIVQENLCNNVYEVKNYVQDRFNEEDIFINYNHKADRPFFEIALESCTFKAKITDEKSCFFIWGFSSKHNEHAFEIGYSINAEWLVNTSSYPLNNGSSLRELEEQILNYRKINDIDTDNKKKERAYLEKSKKHLEIEEEILQESIEERTYTNYKVLENKKYLRIKIDEAQSLISERYTGESFLISSKSEGRDFESLDSFTQNLYEDHQMEFAINPLERIGEKISNEGIIRLDNEYKRIILRKQARGVKTLQYGDGQVPDLLSKLLNPDRLSPQQQKIDVNYFNTNLDESQKKAVQKILSIQNGEFFVLQGPPGTGKTTVIAEIIQQILNQNENAKILVSSQSNQAVDKVLLELKEKNSKLKMVRVGNPDRIKKEQIQSMTIERVTENWLDEFLKDSQSYSQTNLSDQSIKAIQEDWIKILKGKNKNFEEYLLKFVEIIGATCIGIASKVRNMNDLRFDWVIVDEAGRATLQELSIPLSKGNKILLVGDHKQLPPFVDQEASDRIFKKHNIDRSELETSLFEELFDKLKRLNKNDFFDYLGNQYRMHPDIGKVVSELFYEGKIQSPLPADKKNHSINFLNQKAFIWESTAKLHDKLEQKHKSSESWYNPCNAKVILKLLERIEADYQKQEKIENCSVGIITPYVDQVDFLINKKIKPKNSSWKKLKIDIASLDSFQGDERDIIIYDIVRSNSRKDLGFITDARRLNVALSRGKKLLVVVGDDECAYNGKTKNPRQFNPYKDLIEKLRQKNAIQYVQ